jgi:hypothetical protein
MLMRTPRSQRISIEKGERHRLSEAKAAHLDALLDDALRETFPARDPIAICVDRPLEALTLGNLQDPDKVAMPPPALLKATELLSSPRSICQRRLPK